MKTALLKRLLKRLEEVRAVGIQPPVEIQLGYLKKLPPEYTRERHVATVHREADGRYRWEERRGPPAGEEESNASTIVRLVLVSREDAARDHGLLSRRSSSAYESRRHRSRSRSAALQRNGRPLLGVGSGTSPYARRPT